MIIFKGDGSPPEYREPEPSRVMLEEDDAEASLLTNLSFDEICSIDPDTQRAEREKALLFELLQSDPELHYWANVSVEEYDRLEKAALERMKSEPEDSTGVSSGAQTVTAEDIARHTPTPERHRAYVEEMKLKMQQRRLERLGVLEMDIDEILSTVHFQVEYRTGRGMTLYQILGVAENATYEEIKTAYRSIMQEHHEDKGGKEHYLSQIAGEAYNTLKDKNKRAEYDLLLRSGNQKAYRVTPDDMRRGDIGGPSATQGGYDEPIHTDPVDKNEQRKRDKEREERDAARAKEADERRRQEEARIKEEYARRIREVEEEIKRARKAREERFEREIREMQEQHEREQAARQAEIDEIDRKLAELRRKRQEGSTRTDSNPQSGEAETGYDFPRGDFNADTLGYGSYDDMMDRVRKRTAEMEARIKARVEESERRIQERMRDMESNRKKK